MFQAQLGLLVILLIAIADFLIGTFIPPSVQAQAKGFSGFKGNVFGLYNIYFSIFYIAETLYNKL